MTGVSRSSRRILALFLPKLSTDRLHRRAKGASWLSNGLAPDEPPLAVFARAGNAHRLEAVDDRAAGLGLAVHQPLAEARARVPALALVERDAEGEAETLAAIADWCDRFTPLVGLDRDFDGEAGLFLDVTGAAHLFGGEAAMAEEVVARLAGHGFEGRAAIAGTAAAARAVVRAGLDGARRRVVAAGDDAAAVAGLPLAAVDPDAGRRAALARLGLATVADLLALPRAGLARRFGADLLARLDEATGRAERPISPRLPVADVTAERRFFEPISTPEDVAAVTRSLAEAITESLERRGVGAPAIELALWRVDGDVRRIRVATGRPVRDAELLLSLFAERLKGEGGAPAQGRRGRSSDSGFRIAYGMEPGYGFDLVRLSVIAAVPLDPAQIDLSGDAEARVALDRLIDRLGARLGARRVGVALPGDAHVPEEGSLFRPAGAAARRAADLAWSLAEDDPEEPPARPLRLFERPEPIDTVAEIPDGPPLRFRWRRVLYEVARAEGPERIAVPWWRAAPEESGEPSPAANDDAALPRMESERATRDYFRVEDAVGRRFWIFRAGLFGRETIRPRWFLHGLFA